MNFLEKLLISQKVLQAVFFRRKFPLAAMLNITHRCNLRCGYCGAWEKETAELDTKSILEIINKLTILGTKFIKICGGEPLLREDLGEIVDFCKSKKWDVSINSNGTLVKKDFNKIKNIDEIQLSLDGSSEVNDAIRGSGVYDKVIEAIEICKDHNINVVLTTAISKYNIYSISHVLEIARKYRVGVYFQPVDRNLSTYSYRDINSIFSPDLNDYKKVIDYLIKEKRKGLRFIYQSISGLKYLYNWPNHQKVNCLVSLISFIIEPDGKIFTCSCFENYQKYLVSLDRNIESSLNNLSLLLSLCGKCWGGVMLEVNLIGSLKLGAVLELWKRMQFNRCLNKIH